MEVMFFLFLLVIFICLIGFAVDNNNKKPLTEDEIESLSTIRKELYKQSRYTFSSSKYEVNPKYKSCISADGRWDRVDISYEHIAPFITELLRLKRHEWHVYVLADDSRGRYIWCHKGNDNSEVRIPIILMATAAELALSTNCNTVISFHNHPHTQERYWNLLKPSDADYECFETEKRVFCNSGLNLVCGIASQGEFSMYGHAFSEEANPAGCSVEEIKKENGVSEEINRKLHRELKNGRIKLKA